jgi:hypothetical protein
MDAVNMSATPMTVITRRRRIARKSAMPFSRSP